MAMNEACQVWIQQRIQEELQEKGDSGKSLRQIGREIASEIERIFEAKVKPETVKSKVLRAAGSNEPLPETPHPTTVKPGDSGDKLTGEVVMKEINALVDRGKSIREASEVLAEKFGAKPETIRKTYSRAREDTNYQGNVSDALAFAVMAVSQLQRISMDDPQRMAAYRHVYAWMVKQGADLP